MSADRTVHLTVARSSRAEPGEDLQPVSPVDLRPLAPVATASEDSIQAAVDRARLAQNGWAQLPVAGRITALKAGCRDLLARRAEVIELATSEMGKPAIEGLFNEALGPLDALSGWAAVVQGYTGSRHVRLNPVSFPRKRARVDQLPRGVIGIIAPWNFPAAGLYRSVFPALLTGNGLVLKPSEYTPRTSAWLIERLAESLPEGLVQVIQGDGAAGSMLIAAGIDACVFTGSVATGRKVRIHCAERGIPSSIEMGGKDPAIVLADCDLTRTAAGLTHWALSNAGQSCGAIELAYVDTRIADALVQRLARAWGKLRTEPNPEADLGPLANQRQYDLVANQVTDALAKGAKLVCGGVPAAETRRGLFFPPTLLDHCTDEMAVVRDETFGPVLAVVRVEGAEEAVRRANAGQYGLGASVWTGDLARGERLAERLQVGVASVNNHSFTGAIAALPWTGTRATGFGVANGPESLATFVRPRTVVVDSLKAMEPFWLPYDADLRSMGELLGDAQLGKIGQAWRLPLLWRARLKTLREFFR